MSATFSTEDVRLLEKTISIRERLIDNIIKNDLPTKSRDVDSVTNLLESVDRSIFSKAKIKIEDSNTRVNEETKEILKDLLLSLHKAPTSNKPQVKEIPVYKSTDMHISDGELIPKLDSISLE